MPVGRNEVEPGKVPFARFEAQTYSTMPEGLVIPLNNRYQPSTEKQRELRDVQNARKRAREEAKRKAYEEGRGL